MSWDFRKRQAGQPCRFKLSASTFAVILLLATPAKAADPVLDLPVRCTIGEDCVPMALFDHAPGPEMRDFRCAGVTYDGHTGTDIGAIDAERLAQGIEVIAAAAGRVTGIRDGMEDVDVSIAGPASVKDRECGNGVVIALTDGWTTQYCHLRRGSVVVRSGQDVRKGDKLGLMGMSGLASYPHVHLSVMRDGKAIDPFVPNGGVVCPAASATASPGLWSPAAATALQDASAAIVAAGVASQEPRWEDAKAGRLNNRLLPSRGPAFIVWVEVQAVQPGDRLKIRITGPEGQAVFQQSITIDKANLRNFRYFGRRTPAGGWPLGVYQIELTSIRDRDGKEFKLRMKAEMVNRE